MNPGDLHRVAAAYPPEAAMTPAEERERFFTHLQRAAWELRFGGDRKDRVLPAADHNHRTEPHHG